MTSSNTSKINVDMKLKERLKMFEEIDKMVKIDKLNLSNTGLKEDLSRLDNSSLYNYPEKCVSNMDETNDKNFNLPMQSNKFQKKAKQEIPFKNQNLSKPALVMNSESDKCLSKYNTNTNSLESTNVLKSNLQTPDNESFYKRDREKINSENMNNNNLSNSGPFEENKNLNTNFNLYKKNKVSNAKLPLYSSKSPQRKSENLSDFDNNTYDFPQQITKKTIKDDSIGQSYVELVSNKNKNNRTNENHINNNNLHKNKNKGDKNYISNNQIENPFHKNISNELNINSDKNSKSKSKSDNNIKKNYISYINQGKNYSKVSLSTYENTYVNNKNQKANNIKKEVKKDLLECFEYDFYNFPLIKNIPDSKIYGTEQPKGQQEQKNSLHNNNNNYQSINNQFSYYTPSRKAITSFINKHSSNATNRNLNEFLNTNTDKTEPNCSKSVNKTFERSISKTSIKSDRLSRSRSVDNRKNIYTKSNTPENKRLKNLKKFIMNSKDPNFGERLYNYNFYLNEKMKNKLEQEDKQRVRSATPKITRKAKNLQRNSKDFHLRLYPYSNNCQNNLANSELNNSSDIALCSKENGNNFNKNYRNNYQEQGGDANFRKIYDNFAEDDSEINIVYDRNFVQKGLYQEENSIIRKPKRSLSSHDLLGGAVNHSKINFGNKNFENDKANFKPKLNKKSLDIASKFGPAIERLYPKNGLRSKQTQNLQKLEKKINHSYINTPKSYFSNLSEISKRSISPMLHKNSNIFIKRNNSSNKNDAVKRQHELYRKGLEKMKMREEISKEKIQIQSETYKQFSYRPKINSKFTSNITSAIYKTPKNLNSNTKNNTNTKSIKDDTFKFDGPETNLIGSPIDNVNFNSIQQNIDSDDLNFNDFSGNNDNPNNKSNISSTEKFKHIYEKNLIWKKKIENQSQKIKTSEEKKTNENLTFKPQINKVEMKNDEKFIEKNIGHINNYVNKRRANLKKQKEDEDFKKRKFNFGENFSIKPTIPQEFNLLTAQKKSSEKRNNFNKSNVDNATCIKSNSNINYASEKNKSHLRRISNNSNDFVQSRGNPNRKMNDNFHISNNNNLDFRNMNAEKVNSIRSELKIDNFFSEDNKLEIGDKEKRDYFDQSNEQIQNLQNPYNIGHQRYMGSNHSNNYYPNSHNINHYSQNEINFNANNNRRKSFSRDKKVVKIYNNLEGNKNHAHNSHSINNHNSHYMSKNEFFGYNEFSGERMIDESQRDQMDFVNAINNLHDKLANLNI